MIGQKWTVLSAITCHISMMDPIAAASTFNLTVTISAAMSRTGQIFATLFNSPVSYTNKPHCEERAPINDGFYRPAGGGPCVERCL
jgi:uncharacterized protein (DUF2141 family)